MYLLILLMTCSYIISDILMEKIKLEGRYYMNHFICNAIIVYYTSQYMISSYRDTLIYPLIPNASYNNLYVAYSTVYSIHLYHIIWYFKKLRFDDWLHHIMMTCIALPLTSLVNCTNLIAHCLFFITGLPGGMDYILLFLIRNNICDKMIEKKINRLINLWIRCPGCISNVTLVLYNLLKWHDLMTYTELYSSIIIMMTVYWNGIYFMEQVIADYAILKYQYNNNQYNNIKKLKK